MALDSHETRLPTSPHAPPGTAPLSLRGVPFPLLLAGITAVYFIAGKLGLALAFVHANATSVWPPTGIALAAALLFGRRVWPAIFAGAFLVNLTTAGGVATSLGIATGNTLEAVLGAWLVHRFAGGVAAFQRATGVFKFAILAGALATMVSATIGVLSLWLGGTVGGPDILQIWLIWWLGDAVGALVFTPLIVLWALPEKTEHPRRGWLESLALFASVGAVAWTVFHHHSPTAFLCLPPVVWAAYRFGRSGAATVVASISGIALWGTLHGYGPFVRESPNESLLFLQAFVGVITLTALALAAEVRARERAETIVRWGREELERTVEERTASLRDAMVQLERSRTGLNEAQRVGRFGSWEWEPVADQVTWSDEMYRIYGLEPQSQQVDYEGFLSRVHPDDRDRVRSIVQSAFESGEAFEFDHRIVRPDGMSGTLHARGRVVREGGRPVRMLGTAQDVTERIEAARFHQLIERVTKVANEALSADAALRAALAVIGRFKGWPLGHAYVVAADGSGELEPTGIWFPEEPAGHEEFRRVTERTRFRKGIGLPGRVMESGQPAWIPNVAVDRNFPRARLVQELGLAAAFGLPVRVGDETVAVLEFFTTEVLETESAFLAALDEIGPQLGQVLRRQQIEGVLRDREAQLAQAQAIAHVGSWEWNVGANQVAWSDELFRIHGREPGAGDVTYDEFLDHVDPDDRARIDQTVREALAKGGSFEYEYRLIRPDGTSRMVLTQGRVEKDDRGTPVRMYGVCQDTTERKSAEEALRSNEQRYRFLADYSSDMITSLTPEGVCTYVSPASRTLLGYAPKDLLGKPVADLLHPDDLAAVNAARHAILKSIGSQSVTCRLRRKSGSWVWAETTSRGVRDPSTGLVESIVGATRNVTDRVLAEGTIRLLQRVTAIANEATTMDSAMRQALEVIGRFTGWPIGHVYVPSRSTYGELTPSDIWHVEDISRFPDFKKLGETTPLAVGQGLPGRVLASGKAEWVTDVAKDPDFIRKKPAQALGLTSAFAFPLKSQEETLAVLEFFSTELQSLEPNFASLMENVGAQLGQVIRRQRVELALRTSEVRFRAVAETANDAIITIDDQSRIVYSNPAAAQIFGHADLVGRTLDTIMPERFRKAHHAGLMHYLVTHEGPILGKTIELMGLHSSGHELPVELSISDWSTDEGSYFTGIVRDISARKEAEQALNDKVEELARSNAELGLFTYVASHDLREPLRTVASNVQLLERRLGDRLTPAVRKSIDFALDGVLRMQTLINDLLAYSRVGTEGRSLEPVDAEIVLDEVISGLTAMIESEQAVVTRDTMPTVRADRVQLAQVFQNLLSNALKFHGPDPPHVHISAAQNGGEWIFSVRDEGIGFDPEFAEHVFTIFQRLHRPDEYPGTGIGLAICRKVIERHGGRIWAETEPGTGSVFYFTIPDRPRGGTPLR